ncbi:MAG: T9SS type A sorting domain-containing protein, partial [Bacteroidetes bacterium]|nr:T9SS type A sorting domain-containing protein [Bacteroidota bacterium]
MNAHNPHEVDNRFNYYQIGIMPNFSLEGGPKASVPSLTQAKIDQAYDGVTTPFSLTLSHEISQTNDSIRIEVKVKNESLDTIYALGNGSLKLRVALIADSLHFPEAPGNNGEKEFQWAMRKMYPDAIGTVLDSTWLPGQEQTFVFANPLPSYLYNLNEIATVAFIQDDNNKFVYQAERTTPIPITSGVVDTYVEINNDKDHILCAPSFTPQYRVINLGPETLTSFYLNIIKDGVVIDTFLWSGTLGVNDTVIITGNPTSLVGIAATIEAKIYNYSGSLKELNTLNDGLPVKLGSVDQNFLPFSQDFETVILPHFPNGLNSLVGQDAYPNLMTQLYFPLAPNPLGGFGNSPTSLGFLLSFILPSEKTGFVTDNFDLSQINNPKLEFSLAHSFHRNFPEKGQLDIYASNDCGENWSMVFSKSGPELETNTSELINLSVWFPKPHEWAVHTVDLKAYSEEQVILKFVAHNGGMTMYIDDIQLSGWTVGLEETALESAIQIAPNPFQSHTNLMIDLPEEKDLNVEVIDLVGKIVFRQSFRHLGGRSEIRLDGSHWAPGIYQVVVSGPEARIAKKIQVIR